MPFPGHLAIFVLHWLVKCLCYATVSLNSDQEDLHSNNRFIYSHEGFVCITRCCFVFLKLVSCFFKRAASLALASPPRALSPAPSRSPPAPLGVPSRTAGVSWSLARISDYKPLLASFCCCKVLSRNGNHFFPEP